MKKLTLSFLTSTCLALAVSACAAAPEMSSVETVAKEAPVVLDLKAGEVVQFAMFKPRDGDAARDVRIRYFQTAIPYAQSVGNVPLGNLSIQQTMIGKNKPEGIALYKFPSEAAMSEYQASPDWAEYKKMRQGGWAELDIYSITMTSDVQLSFDPDKDYTIAAGWTNLGTEADYETYLDGIEADFDKIGARFVARFRDVNMQSLNAVEVEPSHFTVVEWSDGPNLKGLQSSSAYKAYVKYFQAAIFRFDFYWITTAKT